MVGFQIPNVLCIHLEFIREALETMGNLCNIALDNYCSTLIKLRTQQIVERVTEMDMKKSFIVSAIMLLRKV